MWCLQSKRVPPQNQLADVLDEAKCSSTLDVAKHLVDPGWHMPRRLISGLSAPAGSRLQNDDSGGGIPLQEAASMRHFNIPTACEVLRRSVMCAGS